MPAQADLSEISEDFRLRKSYLTLKTSASITLEINKSVFIAQAARVESDTDALAFAAEIRKKYQDATHNCFACITGPQNEFQKADDDGEPGGTAGKPMLEVIKKNNLSDAAIVVTRYFGGIKLGGGGLIRAYGKSATEAVLAAGIVECVLHSRIAIDISYHWLGLVENQLRNQGYIIADKQFSDQIRLVTLAKVGQENQLQNFVTDITAASASFSIQGSAYVENDVSCKDDS